MDKLILFDIDRTLIIGTKGHKKAFSEAFKRVYSVKTDIDIITPHGMTDQQIIIEVLKKNGLDEEIIKAKMKDCLKIMIRSFNQTLPQDEIIVLDGVRELLEEFKKRNILMGLVTGNLEPIARGKLKKARLNHYFKIGAFGSDDIDRTNLVKIAIKRSKVNFNFKLNNNIFLVGDAPPEIKAGKETGVKTIGVATGIYSMEELKNSGADFVLENLKNVNKVLKIIE